MVRGVLVLFIKSALNSYYRLRDIERGEYEAYLNDIDYKKIFPTLAIGA